MVRNALQQRLPEAQHEAFERIIAESGTGAKYEGVFDPDIEPLLVMFTSPKTGSTYCLKANDMTPETVAAHMAASDARFTPDARHFSR